MRNLTPILQINKFTGSGDGLLYYNEGFVSNNENGNSLLTESFKFEKYFDTTDSGFEGERSGYSHIESMLYLKTKSGGSKYDIFIDAAGQIFKKGLYGYNGFLTELNVFGNKPDLFELPSGNILLSAKDYTYLVVRGYCNAGSADNKIVDGEGRDLITLGASGCKVQSLMTGAIYNITSITTTNSTNDTLNFTAQSGKTINPGDEFFIYIYNKFSMSNDNYQIRQIKQNGDRFYILNGENIAMLSDDEITYDNSYKALPVGFSALSFDVNSGKMLFSAKNNKGISKLLLWDGFSDGWNNILNLDGIVYCVKSYKSGWIYILKGIIYYTDGFSIQKISSYVDSVKVGRTGVNYLSPDTFNGIIVFNELIYFLNSGYSNYYNGPRSFEGVYMFSPTSGWSFLNNLLDGKQFGTPTFISLADETIYVGSYINITKYDTDIGGVSIIRDGSYTDSYLSKSFITYAQLKDEMPIHGIGLTLSFNNDIPKDGYSKDKQTSITVSIGDGNKQLFKQYFGVIISRTIIDVSPYYDVIDVGDELRVIANYSLNNGRRTFVTDKVLGTGGDDTRLTVSPELYSAESGVAPNIQVTKVKKCATKTITETELNREHLFFLPQALFSNKVFIEVVINGIDDSIPISITGINIY